MNKDLISVLLAILKYDFYIICTGVGLVTAADMYNDSLEKERCRERGGYYDFDGDDRGEGRSWGRYENEKEEPVPPLDSAK